MKEITIKVKDDIVSEMADILCYLAGVIDSKNDDWKDINQWLVDSMISVRRLKLDIDAQLRKTKP